MRRSQREQYPKVEDALQTICESLSFDISSCFPMSQFSIAISTVTNGWAHLLRDLARRDCIKPLILPNGRRCSAPKAVRWSRCWALALLHGFSCCLSLSSMRCMTHFRNRHSCAHVTTHNTKQIVPLINAPGSVLVFVLRRRSLMT